jgi:hypothetical protein
MDVEIVEEGEEAETAGPVPSVVKGRSDLFSATYRIGWSRVTEEDLDEFVEHGLLKALHFVACAALLAARKCPIRSPMRLLFFATSLRQGYGFPVKISSARFCNASICKSIS